MIVNADHGSHVATLDNQDRSGIDGGGVGDGESRGLSLGRDIGAESDERSEDDEQRQDADRKDLQGVFHSDSKCENTLPI